VSNAVLNPSITGYIKQIYSPMMVEPRITFAIDGTVIQINYKWFWLYAVVDS
jgi:transposase-like protein